MNILRRRPKLPASLRPSLGPQARVVAWAAVGEDGALVATNRGLRLPDGRRLGWHEIHKAAWSGRELRITPAVVAEERDGYTVLADGPVEGFLLLSPAVRYDSGSPVGLPAVIALTDELVAAGQAATAPPD